MDIRWYYGIFGNGNASTNDGVVRVDDPLPAIRTTGSITKNVSLDGDEATVSIPAREGKDWGSFLVPFRHMLVAVDADVAKSDPYYVVFAGPIDKITTTVNGTVVVHAASALKYLDRRVASWTQYTKAISSPMTEDVKDEYSGDGWHTVAKRLIRQGFGDLSEITLPVKPPQVLGNVTIAGTVEDKTRTLKVAVSEQRTILQSLTEVTETRSKTFFEIECRPRYRSSDDHILFDFFMNAGSGSNLTNGDTERNVDLATLRVSKKAVQKVGNADNLYNAILGQSSQDDEKIDARYLVKDDDLGLPLLEGFFNPDTEIDKDSMLASLQSLIDTTTDIGEFRFDLAGGDYRDWIATVGCFMTFEDDNAPESTWYQGVRARMTSMVIDTSSTRVSFTIEPVLPSYPRIKKKKNKGKPDPVKKPEKPNTPPPVVPPTPNIPTTPPKDSEPVDNPNLPPPTDAIYGFKILEDTLKVTNPFTGLTEPVDIPNQTSLDFQPQNNILTAQDQYGRFLWILEFFVMYSGDTDWSPMFAGVLQVQGSSPTDTPIYNLRHLGGKVRVKVRVGEFSEGKIENIVNLGSFVLTPDLIDELFHKEQPFLVERGTNSSGVGVRIGTDYDNGSMYYQYAHGGVTFPSFTVIEDTIFLTAVFSLGSTSLIASTTATPISRSGLASKVIAIKRDNFLGTIIGSPWTAPQVIPESKTSPTTSHLALRGTSSTWNVSLPYRNSSPDINSIYASGNSTTQQQVKAPTQSLIRAGGNLFTFYLNKYIPQAQNGSISGQVGFIDSNEIYKTSQIGDSIRWRAEELTIPNPLIDTSNVIVPPSPMSKKSIRRIPYFATSYGLGTRNQTDPLWNRNSKFWVGLIGRGSQSNIVVAGKKLFTSLRENAHSYENPNYYIDPNDSSIDSRICWVQDYDQNIGNQISVLKMDLDDLNFFGSSWEVARENLDGEKTLARPLFPTGGGLQASRYGKQSTNIVIQGCPVTISFDAITVRTSTSGGVESSAISIAYLNRLIDNSGSSTTALTASEVNDPSIYAQGFLADYTFSDGTDKEGTIYSSGNMKGTSVNLVRLPAESWKNHWNASLRDTSSYHSGADYAIYHYSGYVYLINHWNFCTIGTWGSTTSDAIGRYNWCFDGSTSVVGANGEIKEIDQVVSIKLEPIYTKPTSTLAKKMKLDQPINPIAEGDQFPTLP